MAGLSMIRMAMDVLKILSDHYPERLGTAWMVHPSWSFTFFWKSISPFIDNVTKKKIFFINKLQELKDWIDEDVLEAEYGGKNEKKYSYDEIKDREDTLFPPYNEDGTLVTTGEETAAEDGEKKKKKKKKKKVAEGEEAVEDVEGVTESSDAQSAATSASEPSDAKESKKSKKSKKQADASASEAAEEEEHSSAADSASKAKSTPDVTSNGNDDSVSASKKKKSKKNVAEVDA